MAKYTELFSEYLEAGGELPALFSQIEGFTDLFKAHFCDKEIGFETESLFAIKLEEYAHIYIPIYKQRIDDLATAITNARNPVKVFYEKYNTIIDAGEQNARTTDLPFNATEAEPNSLTHSDAYHNEDERETNRKESGVNVTEAYAIIDNLNKQVTPLIYKLLGEFDRCFMKVY